MVVSISHLRSPRPWSACRAATCRSGSSIHGQAPGAASSRSSSPRPSTCSRARCAPATRSRPACRWWPRRCPSRSAPSSGSLYDRQNFGMPMPEALKAFARARAAARRAVLRHRRADAARGGRQPRRSARQPGVGDPRAVQGQASGPRRHRARANTGWVLALLPPSLGVVLTLSVAGPHEPALDRSARHQDDRRRAVLQVVGDADHPQAGGRGVPRRMATIRSSLALVLVFFAVAVLAGWRPRCVLSRTSPERRRLARDGRRPRGGSPSRSATVVAHRSARRRSAKRVSTFVPKSPKEMNRLQRRMVRAGYQDPQPAAVMFAAAEIVCPSSSRCHDLSSWAWFAAG